MAPSVLSHLIPDNCPHQFCRAGACPGPTNGGAIPLSTIECYMTLVLQRISEGLPSRFLPQSGTGMTAACNAHVSQMTPVSKTRPPLTQVGARF
jgi:hypothetical protein